MDIVLVDAKEPGSGTAFDWALADVVPPGVRLLLAGGLNGENVAPAIRRVRPWGVDVSTGVETTPEHVIAPEIVGHLLFGLCLHRLAEHRRQGADKFLDAGGMLDGRWVAMDVDGAHSDLLRCESVQFITRPPLTLIACPLM